VRKETWETGRKKISWREAAEGGVAASTQTSN
jgi:hypothetical protein